MAKAKAKTQAKTKTKTPRSAVWAKGHRVTKDDEAALELLDQVDEPFKPLVIKKGGVLAGKQLGQRDIVALAEGEGWTTAENLATVGMIAGAESWRYAGAYNDNTNGTRDVGLMQINIPAEQIGTQFEKELYDPVTNMHRARQLYEARTSATTTGIRGWTPWVSYNNGIYLHDTYRAWGLLGLLNWLDAAQAGEIPVKLPDYTPKLKVPLISVPQLRTLYPGVIL